MVATPLNQTAKTEVYHATSLQEAAKGNKMPSTNESMKKTCMSFVVLSEEDKMFW